MAESGNRDAWPRPTILFDYQRTALARDRRFLGFIHMTTSGLDRFLLTSYAAPSNLAVSLNVRVTWLWEGGMLYFAGPEHCSTQTSHYAG